MAFKTRSSFRPTEEQTDCILCFGTGEAVTIRALAGTGKTTTLRLCAESQPERWGSYLAYNKAIADDAQDTFPSSVDCRTAHSMAFQQLGHVYADRLNSPRVPLPEIAKALRLKGSTSLAGRVLNPSTVARITADTVSQFCYSADEDVMAKHVPETKGIDTPQQRRLLAEMVVPSARIYWQDLQQVEGIFKFTHDHYLKMWGLSRPRLEFDYLLFDEAQDANPVIADVVQRQNHIQRIAVGDNFQAIYGWRGAIDAMDSFGAEWNLTLQQSFRFGPEIAKVANYFLEQLGTEMRVLGLAGAEGVVGSVPWPSALLCRTNAGCLTTVMSCLEKNIRVALVGGVTEITRFCQAANQLKAGKRTTHEELCAFRTWGEVQDYVDGEEVKSDLGRMVDLVDKYGTEELVEALGKTVPERAAQVVVSTAHKAKGREWESIRLHSDFERPGDFGDCPKVSDAETRLRYVAATRAKKQLDLGPLTRKYRMPPAPRPAVAGMRS